MEYGNAQTCVMSGTHRWADDETDLPNHVQALISDRDREQAELDASNSELNARLRAEREEQERLARLDEMGVIMVTKVGEGEVYLARPFPNTASFGKNLFEPVDGVIGVAFNNAMADYKVVSETDDDYIAELLSHESPDVDIPDDWRDKKPMQLAAIAKKIRGTSDSMKADEARAVIEEWTRKDDQVSDSDAGAGEGETQAPDTENRNKADVPATDLDGKPVLSPEERAKQAEKEVLQDDFDV